MLFLDINQNIKIVFFVICLLIFFFLLLYFIFHYIFKKIRHCANNKNKLNLIKHFYVIKFQYYGTDDNFSYYDGSKILNLLNYDITDKINFYFNNIMKDIRNKKIRKNIADLKLLFGTDGMCNLFIYVYTELSNSEKDFILDFLDKEILKDFNNKKFCINDNNRNIILNLGNKDKSKLYFVNNVDLFTKIANQIKINTEKDCMKINLVNELSSILDNKLGGVPYLPLGYDIPKDSKGKDMNLLIQINLKDVVLDNFPNKGILEIFYSELVEPFEYKLLYFDEITEYRKDLNINPNNNEIVIGNGYKFFLSKTKVCMPSSDYRFNSLILLYLNEILNISEDYRIKSGDYYSGLYCDSKIIDIYYNITKYDYNLTVGGYGDFVQNDPRDYDLDYSNKDICLLKLDDTEYIDKIYLGGGTLWAYINKEELKSANFENVKIDWDCL